MTLRRHSLMPAVLLVLLTLGWPNAASAQDGWGRLVIRSGALVADFTSNVRIDPAIGREGTSIDVENDLQFDSAATTFFADGTWRVSRRNQIKVSYFAINRDVSRAIINRPITIGDTTFNVNAQVDAFLDTSYIAGDYGFAFIANPMVEVGVSLGLTALKLHTGAGVSASVGSRETVSRELTVNKEFTAPIPLAGVFVNLHPQPRVIVNGYWRYIAAKVGSIDGSVSEARASVDIMLTRAVGIGGAYYDNRVDIGREGTGFNGRVKYNFSGPQIYGVLKF